MIKKTFTLFNNNPINALAKILDKVRIHTLRRTLKINFLRNTYRSSHKRLALTYLNLTLIYLPIALIRPDILLIIGPLIYGYFHLVTSYYFTQPFTFPMDSKKILPNKFLIFCIFTLIVIIINFVISKTSLDSFIPNDFLEIIIAGTIFLLIMIKAKFKNRGLIIFVLLSNIFLLNLSWQYPLNFISTTLIVHNWVAFIYWIVCSKNKKNRIVAVTATSIFGVIHYLVFTGSFDSLILLQVKSSFLSPNLSATSWLLAPWSNDYIMGQRLLTLYTFGLSLHYFIWLKAIPENRQVRETPYSYREGYKNLKNNIGQKLGFITITICLAGILYWMFNLEYGAKIYFAIATLHAWLELNFLFSRIFIKE